ncbi:MAG: Fis family transcriptional regulator [Proteobacteria bacterium]|nr:Fis family transcriptional regulator [Pseudomonadota bacterium]
MLEDNIIARHVRQALREYLKDLDGENSIGIRDMVVESVEKPVIETILEHVEGNQTRAAAMLGLNRNTLRKKIKIYKIKM